MDKGNTHQNDPDYDDLDAEITRKKISRILKEHPRDYIEKLEEIGFFFHDDYVDYVDDDNYEELEEADAKPVNPNQEYLVSFFDGDIPLSEQTVEIFLEEWKRPGSNLPVIRKYFRQANKRLLSMLLRGLQRYPVSVRLLSDLAYFHEFSNILIHLIDYYTVACAKEQDLSAFSRLAIDFYFAVLPDGYDALNGLKEVYSVGTDKREAVIYLMKLEQTRVAEGGDIEF